jgi:serine/threonine-protein kinase HipA
MRLEGGEGASTENLDRQGTDCIGYASAMTMLEASDGDQRSYLEIAQVIEERSPAATVELCQLWRRICFTILISNTDDHLRNHGFLHERAESWRMSPAFDMNPYRDLAPIAAGGDRGNGACIRACRTRPGRLHRGEPPKLAC